MSNADDKITVSRKKLLQIRQELEGISKDLTELERKARGEGNE